VDETVADVWRALGVAAVVSFAAAALLAALLSRNLLERLVALRDAVRRFDAAPGEDGRDDDPAAAAIGADSRPDELGELARAFAAMSRRVRGQETARRRFVATASHELRTPVSALRASLELLEAELHDAEPPSLDVIQRKIASARGQAARLGVLADELLELSRVDAGLKARSEPVEVGDLVQDVLAEFRDRAEHGGTPIELDVAGGELWVQGDPGGLARVMRILIDNALRFAPRGTAVSIRAGAEAITVTDAGPGIAADEREAIFERFTRGRNAGASAGFGLGLAIGRELMRRMHGDLLLDPDPPRGARFRVVLPPTVCPRTATRRSTTSRASAADAAPAGARGPANVPRTVRARRTRSRGGG
jgi:signal transduction histidine kinase